MKCPFSWAKLRYCPAKREMRIQLQHQGQSYTADLSQPQDISLPLDPAHIGVNAWYAPPFRAEPVRMGDFVGSVAEGGVVNFLNVHLNPHGNGTHTECVGHISAGGETINQSLQQFHFIGKLISVFPQQQDNGDRVITLAQMQDLWHESDPAACLIRTLPNDDYKRSVQYGGSNPPYLAADAARYLVDCGVEHLLLDLPSVDREMDEGALAAHHVFWQYPEATRHHATITEMIYVAPEVSDGLYLVNIQIASFEIDASPSKVVLYRLEK